MICEKHGDQVFINGKCVVCQFGELPEIYDIGGWLNILAGNCTSIYGNDPFNSITSHLYYDEDATEEEWRRVEPTHEEVLAKRRRQSGNWQREGMDTETIIVERKSKFGF